MNFVAAKTAYLFPGQGSQKVGMGKDLAANYKAARRIFEQADDILGFSISNICWHGPEEQLNDTINTQPALLVHSIAVLEVLQKIYPDFTPSFLAGHSMGEFSALVAAKSLTFEQALILIRKRGELMKIAGETFPGGMGAVLGLDVATMDKICEQASHEEEIVQVANDNCPGQVVISGDSKALDRAMTLAGKAGARKVLSLAVSIAAHSPLMASAQEEFNHAVGNTQIARPQTGVIGNVSASPLRNQADIQADLHAQLTTRVRWTESIQFMLEQGVDTFIEIGTGIVLSSLVKRIDRSAARLSLGKPEDFDKLPTNV